MNTTSLIFLDQYCSFLSEDISLKISGTGNNLQLLTESGPENVIFPDPDH